MMHLSFDTLKIPLVFFAIFHLPVDAFGLNVCQHIFEKQGNTLSSIFTNPVRIEGLESLKIPYTSKHRPFQEHRSTAEKKMQPRSELDNNVLEVELGPLTKAEFDKVTKLFDGVKAPEFRAGKVYRLTEFMPPLIQALEGRQFKPIQEPYAWPEISEEDRAEGSMELEDLVRFNSNQTPVSTLINCWTTAYEVLRTLHTAGEEIEIDLTWLSRSTATHLIMDDAMKRLNTRAAPRFGDLLVFSDYNNGSDTQLVQHAAFFILPGLYFEKTDSTEDDAFRFVLEKDLRDKYRAVLSPKARTAHYRLKADAQFPRLRDTQPLIVDSAEAFGKYLPEKDMKTLTLQFDWESGMSGFDRPVFFPYRLRSIGLVKTNGVFSLDPNNPIISNFQKPDFK